MLHHLTSTLIRRTLSALVMVMVRYDIGVSPMVVVLRSSRYITVEFSLTKKFRLLNAISFDYPYSV